MANTHTETPAERTARVIAETRSVFADLQVPLSHVPTTPTGRAMLRAQVATFSAYLDRLEELTSAVRQQDFERVGIEYDKARVLLLSSSKTPGNDSFLAYAQEEIRSLFSGVRRVLFIPYAEGIAGKDEYTATVRKVFKKLIGVDLKGIHEYKDAVRAVENAEAIFVGGGNTFLLLRELYSYGLIQPLRTRVEQGTPYLGSSAGSNVAMAGIFTTNDMPAVLPPSLRALGILPALLNPHYMDEDQNSQNKHRGETRRQRIEEVLRIHGWDSIPAELPVLALKEGGYLKLDSGHLSHGGEGQAFLFKAGRKRPQAIKPGSNLDFLLK